MTKTSLFPVRLLVKAIHFPSGEKRGPKSLARCAVSRCACDPSASATQMSSWYENAMRPSLATCGVWANLMASEVWRAWIDGMPKAPAIPIAQSETTNASERRVQ